MKAMILAAGRGERMRPITDSCPKPLIKVQGKSLIEYHIQALAASGISKIAINHAWLGEQIIDQLGSGEQWGVEIYYSQEKIALETAGGIIKIIDYLSETNDCFLVLNGDIFTNYNFQNLMRYKEIFCRHKKLAHLVMVSNPDFHPQGDFYYKDNGLYAEQAEEELKRLTFSGISIYHKDFFSGLKQGKQALRPLLNQAIKLNKVSAEHYTGLWSDVGTVDRLKELEMNLMKNSG